MTARRVLIIDDDREYCMELVETLKGENCRAEYECDAWRGEQLIKSGGYDTVLLDHKMSEMTGTEMLKRLKNCGVKSRIFIVSGRPSVEEEIRKENLFDMVSGIIMKPLDLNEFLRRVMD